MVRMNAVLAAETLGVSVDCRDENEIKKAYRRMALKYHPDKNVDLTPEMAKAKFQDVADAFERMSKVCSGVDSGEEEDGPPGFYRADPDMDVHELFAQMFGQMFGGGMPGGFPRGFQPRGGFRQPEEEEEEDEEEDGWSDDADSDNMYVFDPFEEEEEEEEEEEGEGGDGPSISFVPGVGFVMHAPVGGAGAGKKKATGEPKRDPTRAGGVAAAATKAAAAAAKRGVAPGRGAKSAPGGVGGAAGGAKKKKRK